MEQQSSLEGLVEKIAEAVLATTETVNRLSDRVDHVATQVQQQGYQIFALSDAIQTLAENHDGVLAQMGQLSDSLKRLVASIEETDDFPE